MGKNEMKKKAEQRKKEGKKREDFMERRSSGGQIYGLTGFCSGAGAAGAAGSGAAAAGTAGLDAGAEAPTAVVCDSGPLAAVGGCGFWWVCA